MKLVGKWYCWGKISIQINKKKCFLTFFHISVFSALPPFKKRYFGFPEKHIFHKLFSYYLILAYSFFLLTKNFNASQDCCALLHGLSTEKLSHEVLR